MNPGSGTAIVILNWNGKALLDRFLPGVIANSPGATVVVADNGSKDGSPGLIAERFPMVRLIRFEKNLGFAAGYNEALRQTQARYYILLNSDVEVTTGWLPPLEQWMDSHPGCAACQPVIRSYADKSRFEHAGAAGGFIDRWGYPFCRGRLFATTEVDRGQYNDTLEVFWASGACLFIRAEAFQRAGGFDESFFAHMEEIDLCWRIKRAGNSVYCVTGSVVYHVGGGTLPKKNPRKTYLNFRNNLMMLHKNLPPGGTGRVLFVRLLLDKLAALKFFLDGDWSDFFAVVRAYAHFYSHLGSRRREKKRVAGVTPQFHVTRVYKRSVVVQYFIKRIRTCSGLGNHFSAGKF